MRFDRDHRPSVRLRVLQIDRPLKFAPQTAEDDVVHHDRRRVPDVFFVVVVRRDMGRLFFLVVARLKARMGSCSRQSRASLDTQNPSAFGHGDDIGPLKLHSRLDVSPERPVFATGEECRDRWVMADLLGNERERGVAVHLQLVGFAEQRIERLRHALEMRGEIGDDERGEQVQPFDRRRGQCCPVDQRRVLECFSETLKKAEGF